MSTQADSDIGRNRLIAMRRGIASARAVAQGDAEGFIDLVMAIEDLGAAWHGQYAHLRAYEKTFIANLGLGPEQHDFQRLYRLVTWSRNTTVHAGAWARHATTNAVDLAVQIEDALARKIMAVDPDGWRVEYFMVPNPISGELWQPVSELRRCMLRNSFSFLPVFPGAQSKAYDPHRWYVLSDHALARWLGEPTSDGRRKKGGTPLAAALDLDLALEGPATLLSPQSSRTQALDATTRWPALVSSGTDDPTRIMGIVTAFDLL